jgi:hypothetical protein
MRKYGFSALVAAGLLVGGLTASSASAADLGGNCCADLEERIAELEATTARKGNRKVSLTISGWVAEQVMWWDDGFEQNVYVGGIGTTLASHFKMTGAALIAPGLSAGYVIHVELNDADALTWNQISEHNASAVGANGAFAIQTLQTYWFLKSNHMGKVSVGLQSTPSDNAAILVDGSGSLVPANWVMFDWNSFILRNTAGFLGVNPNNTAQALTWQQIGGFCRGGGGAGGDCFGAPRDAIRYDSPTYHGFSVSAGWGEDDFWDVAARYAGEWSGFKVAAAAAYTQWTPDFAGPTGAFSTVNVNGDTDYFQAGLYVEHIPTGLWAYGAYGHIETDGLTADVPLTVIGTVTGGFNIADGDTYYVKGGLRERWHPLGHTVLYGEYAQYQDSQSDLVTNAGFTGAETEMWGVGIVQEIDPAAMSMWLSYRHIEGDFGNCTVGEICDTGTPSDFALEDFQYVKFGALINF